MTDQSPSQEISSSTLETTNYNITSRVTHSIAAVEALNQTTDQTQVYSHVQTSPQTSAASTTNIMAAQQTNLLDPVLSCQKVSSASGETENESVFGQTESENLAASESAEKMFDQELKVEVLQDVCSSSTASGSAPSSIGLPLAASSPSFSTGGKVSNKVHASPGKLLRFQLFFLLFNCLFSIDHNSNTLPHLICPFPRNSSRFDDTKKFNNQLGYAFQLCCFSSKRGFDGGARRELFRRLVNEFS